MPRSEARTARFPRRELLPLVASLMLLCVNGRVWCQLTTTQCTFRVNAPNARIVARSGGGSPISIAPGQTVGLLVGKWSFHVSAPGYKTQDFPRSVSGSSFSYSFTLTKEFVCKVCQPNKKFASQAELNRHLLDVHTYIKVSAIAPGDAKLTLDDAKPIKAGQQIKVSPGRHTIKGDSPRGYLESPVMVDVALGKPETISKITVPDVPGKLVVGQIDPADAAITVDGKTIKLGGIVEIRPPAGKPTASVVVSATAPGCVPWSKQYELGWKQKQVVPDIRLAYGTLKITVEPVEFANSIRVELIDDHSQPVALPQNGRVPPGKYKLKATNAPTDYQQSQPDKTYEIKDHAPVELAKVVVVKEDGYIRLSFSPEPAARVFQVYGGNQPVQPENDGRYRLPAGKHDLKITADGFEDRNEQIIVPSRDTAQVRTSLLPKPGSVSLRVEPKDAEVELTLGGAVAATDKSTSPDKVIMDLKVSADGSSRTYHCRVSRAGYLVDILTAAWEGDVTVERDKKTVVTKAIVLTPELDLIRAFASGLAKAAAGSDLSELDAMDKKCASAVAIAGQHSQGSSSTPEIWTYYKWWLPYTLGQLYIRAGFAEQNAPKRIAYYRTARAQLEAAASADADNPAIAHSLAWTLTVLGQTDRALLADAGSRFAALAKPESTDGRLLEDYAAMLKSSGDKSAKDVLDRAIGLGFGKENELEQIKSVVATAGGSK